MSNSKYIIWVTLSYINVRTTIESNIELMSAWLDVAPLVWLSFVPGFGPRVPGPFPSLGPGLFFGPAGFLVMGVLGVGRPDTCLLDSESLVTIFFLVGGTVFRVRSSFCLLVVGVGFVGAKDSFDMSSADGAGTLITMK